MDQQSYDRVEIRHPKLTKQLVRFLADFAEQRGLCLSGNSHCSLIFLPRLDGKEMAAELAESLSVANLGCRVRYVKGSSDVR